MAYLITSTSVSTSELFINIKKRTEENYIPPFTEDVPDEWRRIVSRGIVSDIGLSQV